jgi:hypothetical protein
MPFSKNPGLLYAKLEMYPKREETPRNFSAFRNSPVQRPLLAKHLGERNNSVFSTFRQFSTLFHLFRVAFVSPLYKHDGAAGEINL